MRPSAGSSSGLQEITSRHQSVRGVRGTGYFYAIELMGDRDSGRELATEQSLALLREVIPTAMRKVGLITRPDERGAAMLLLSPPLIADGAVLEELLGMVDAMLTETDRYTHGRPGDRVTAVQTDDDGPRRTTCV